jgi:hypothetical protein
VPGRVQLDAAAAFASFAAQAEPAEGAGTDRRRSDPPELGDRRPERIRPQPSQAAGSARRRDAAASARVSRDELRRW